MQDLSNYGSKQLIDDLSMLGINGNQLLEDCLVNMGYSLTYDDGKIVNAEKIEDSNIFSHDFLNELNYDLSSYFFVDFKQDSSDGCYYLDTSQRFVFENNELDLSVLTEYIEDMNEGISGYKLELNETKDGRYKLVKNYSLTETDCSMLNSVYDGSMKLEQILTDPGAVSCICSKSDFLKQFGYDGITEKSYQVAYDKALASGIKFTLDGDNVSIKLSISEEMNDVEQIFCGLLVPLSNINGTAIDEECYLELSEDEYFRLFGCYSETPPSVVNIDYLFKSIFNDDKYRTLDTLSEEEKLVLANYGYFIVDGKLCNGLFTDDIWWEGIQSGGKTYYRVSVPTNLNNFDDVMFYVLNGNDYNDYLTSSSIGQSKNFTDVFNSFTGDVVSKTFGITGLNVFPVQGENYESKFYNNITDYNNSSFLVNYNGHQFYVNNDNVNGALSNINSQILNVVSKDKQNYENLGFTMSVLIGSDLDKIEYQGNSNVSNLKSKGYSDIVLDGENYKIYLENGQHYIIGKESEYSVLNVVDQVERSDAMLNLNIQKKLTENNLKGCSVDVRQNADYYEVYVDGNVYEIERSKVEKIDENEQLVVSEDLMAKAIFNEIEIQRENGNYVDKKSRNDFVASSMFVPCIELKNEEYYRNLCKHLNEYNVKIMEYSNRISVNVNIDSKFYVSNNLKQTFCEEIKDVADECVKLSKKIEYCVNLVTQCDNSLKDVLDEYIAEFFDTEFSEIVTRSDNNYGTVNTQNYIDFFSKKMAETKEQVKIYEQLLKGNIEIPADLTSVFDKYGISYEEISVNGQKRFFATGANVSNYVSIKENVVFTTDYSIYDWLLDDSNFVADNYYNTGGFDGLKANITLSSYVATDIVNIYRTKNSIESFCNMDSYLKYVFSDEYSSLLKDVQNGKEIKYNCEYLNGKTVDFPEYFTDFQKVLYFLEMNDKMPTAYKNYYDQMIPFTNPDSYTNYVLNQEKACFNSISSIVPYSYNEIAGYNEAIKEIESWYNDGTGIDLLDAAGYDIKKFWKGFTDVVSNIGYIFNPETSISDHKMRYIGEFLLNTTSRTIDDVNLLYKNGEITEYDRDLQIKMINCYDGFEPSKVQELADLCESGGKIVSEVALYAATNGAYLSKMGFSISNDACKRVLATVKGLSTTGKNTNKLYSKGYSYGTSLTAGVVSGIITGLCYTSFGDKLFKKGGSSYNINIARGTIARDYTKLFSASSQDVLIFDRELFNKLNLSGKFAYIWENRYLLDVLPKNNFGDALFASLNGPQLMLFGGTLNWAANASQAAVIAASGEYQEVGYLPDLNMFANSNRDDGKLEYNILNAFFKRLLGQRK